MSEHTTTRRNFLTAATIGAGLTYIPSSVRGANEKIGIGVIGVGGRGTGLLRQLVTIRDTQETIDIVAVCDVYQRRLNEAVEISGAKPFKNYRDLLDAPGIDAVVIATPDHWHARMTIDACKKGKDVYCEKPMTRTFEEAKAVWETVEKEKRVMQVGSQHASEDQYWQVRKAIQGGVLGPLVSAVASASRNSVEGEWNYKIEPEAGPDQEGENHIDWNEWLGSAPKLPYDPEHFFRFRKFWEYSGGIATDLFYHRLTGLTIGWGGNQFPWRASSLGNIVVFKDRQVPDTTSLLVDYTVGHHVVLYGSMANTTGLELSWNGHEASITQGRLTPQALFSEGFRQRAEAAGLEGEWMERSSRRGGNREVVISELRFNEHKRPDHMENFLTCIRTREKPVLDALTGFQIMTSIAMGVESFRTGKTWYFDEKKMKITDTPIQRNHLIG